MGLTQALVNVTNEACKHPTTPKCSNGNNDRFENGFIMVSVDPILEFLDQLLFTRFGTFFICLLECCCDNPRLVMITIILHHGRSMRWLRGRVFVREW